MRVLIIGLGSIARKHIAALKALCPDVEIFALRSSVNAPQVSDVSNLYDIKLIGSLQIDFIIISNPTFKHREAIENTLYLDLPLFIEKPLFDKLLKKESLLKSIKEKNIVTYVACNLRFLECLQFVKTFIADKRINEVNIYCGSYLPDWRPNQNFREIYSANKEMGGGVHIDLIHEFDYAFWMFGKPVDVRRTTTSSSSLKITAVDYANYLLLFNDYAINIILNYFRRDAKRTLEVVCDEGTIEVNLLKGDVLWNRNLVFQTKQNIIDTYKDQMAFFLNNIITEKNSFNTIHEAYEILKICLAKE